MTLSQLLDYVRDRHREPSTGGNWSDQEIYQLVTARIDEILSIIGLLEDTDTSNTSVTGTQAISFPSDAIAIKAVLYDGELLKQIDFKQWETFKSGGTTPSRTPEAYVIWKREILLVPIPSTTGDTITIYYFKEHPYIDEGTDTIDIPSVLHFRLAEGVIGDMFVKDLNSDMARFYEEKWLNVHLPAIREYAMREIFNQADVITDVETVLQGDFGVI